MYKNFADGIVDPDKVEYCPVCGKKVSERCRESGEVTCGCGFKFFVVALTMICELMDDEEE